MNVRARGSRHFRKDASLASEDTGALFIHVHGAAIARYSAVRIIGLPKITDKKRISLPVENHQYGILHPEKLSSTNFHRKDAL
jgi:hypothetical protein